MKSNEIRGLTQSLLEQVNGRVYYGKADEDVLYPHIVHRIERVDMIAEHRDDISVEVNVWSKSEREVNDLADSVEAALKGQNLPQENILPTYYLESRVNVEDEDKDLHHILLNFNVQNYER